MSHILSLPLDILYSISDHVDDPADLSSWSRSCRALHDALTRPLYYKVKDNPTPLCWACDEGRLSTVQRLLNAGANPGARWVQEKPRWQTLYELHHEGSGREESSMYSQEARERAKVRMDISQWLWSFTAIDHRMIDCFEDADYNVGLVPREFRDASRYFLGQHNSTPTTPFQSGWTFPQQCYWSPLHIAAACGNNELVNLLLDKGAEINSLSRLFCQCATLPNRNVAPLWTPLHTAICHGHESTSRLLLLRGASINIMTRQLRQDRQRFTALHSACTVGLLDTVQALVEGGYQTDVTVCDHNDMTPLAYAFSRGNWPVVDFLLEHGANINDQIGPLNALGHACLLGFYAEAIRLLDLGATPQRESDSRGGRAIYFHIAAVAGAPSFPSYRSSHQILFRSELITRLIQHGIDVDQKGVDGTTALTKAARYHRVAAVKTLLHAGADVRARTGPGFSGRSALMEAIRQPSNPQQSSLEGDMIQTVRVLLEAMAQTPAQPRSMYLASGVRVAGTTDDFDVVEAFRLACKLPYELTDKMEVITLLLENKRAVQIANGYPDAVFTTLRALKFDLASLLLDSGFTRPSDQHMEDLINIFIKNDTVEGLHYMMRHFPDTAPRFRSSMLAHRAISMGKKKCAVFLMEAGAMIDSLNTGISLLAAACTAEDTSIARLLLDNGANPNECTADGYRLTVVAAFRRDTDMIRLLLDYGASIHSCPPGLSTRDAKVGLLDIVIHYELIDSLKEITRHKRYGSPTEKEISTHWRTIISSPSRPARLREVFGALLGSKGFVVDQMLTVKDDQATGLGRITATPLQLCIAIGAQKTDLILELIKHEASIHKRVPARLNSQVHTLPESKLKGWGICRFEVTTPLGLAIVSDSIDVVRAILKVQDFNSPFPPVAENGVTKEEVMAHYAEAACRCLNPEMFSLLFMYSLNPSHGDEDGNTMAHMICDYVETLWPNSRPRWTMEYIAKRSASCLILCMKWRIDYGLRNNKGVSAMDRVLEILKYSGDCEFRQTLARLWSDRINYVEDPLPRLTANFAALGIVESKDENEVLWGRPLRNWSSIMQPRMTASELIRRLTLPSSDPCTQEQVLKMNRM